VTVLGPYSPKQFSDIGALGTLITTESAGLVGTTLVSAEPVTVLGNIFIVYTTVP